MKGVNQDAMIVCENFTSREDTVFCGVFDGHGPNGHHVARRVRDLLPVKLGTTLQNGYAQERSNLPYIVQEHVPLLHTDEDTKFSINTKGNGRVVDMYNEFRDSFVRAFAVMDNDLRSHRKIDCYLSGTTAVVLVKKGDDLIVGNVGDSRAVLATMDKQHGLVAVPLTEDLKPTNPREAERIRQCGGRIYALRDEPMVARVWLPQRNIPGLAMARAFGDFCLKDFGLICDPDVYYRQLDENDLFVVLATDGIWDVLSNAQVVSIVASAPRQDAARILVERANKAWKYNMPNFRVDDCAAVCLFLDNKAHPFSSTGTGGRSSDVGSRER